jgi:hypothetical protein
VKTSTIRIDIYIMHLVLLPNTLYPITNRYDLKGSTFNKRIVEPDGGYNLEWVMIITARVFVRASWPKTLGSGSGATSSSQKHKYIRSSRGSLLLT